MATDFTVTGGSVSVLEGQFTANFTINAVGGSFVNNDIIYLTFSGLGLLVNLTLNDEWDYDWDGGNYNVYVIAATSDSFSFSVSWGTPGPKTIEYDSDPAMGLPPTTNVTVTASIGNKSRGGSLARHW